MTYYKYRDPQLGPGYEAASETPKGDFQQGRTVGDNNPNELWGSGSQVLRGFGGGDTYFLEHSTVTVEESDSNPATGGYDQIVAYHSVSLEEARYANIENLRVVNGAGELKTAQFRYGEGDAADNVIEGVGRVDLYGGLGEDVLVGLPLNDQPRRQVFIVNKGEGNDVIYGFDLGAAGDLTHDIIRLKANGWTSLAQFRHKLQDVEGLAVGPNDPANWSYGVELDMGDGSRLLIRGVRANQLEDRHFQLQFDTSLRSDRLSFNEDFRAPLSMYDEYHAPTGKWAVRYAHDGNHEELNAYRLNDELQLYTSPYFRRGLGETPNWQGAQTHIWDGSEVLTLRGQPEQSHEFTFGGQTFQHSSGLINTFETFSQTYGYFEMRAQVPTITHGGVTDVTSTGAWPAFWLLREDSVWPGEIDIMEMNGGDPEVVVTTTHSGPNNVDKWGSSAFVPGLSDGWHTFGLLWTEQTIVWYVDGLEVFRQPTPADIVDQPMFLLANLALGGSMGGALPSDFERAEFKIDYIKAYPLAVNASPSAPEVYFSTPSMTRPEGASGSTAFTFTINRPTADVVSTVAWQVGPAGPGVGDHRTDAWDFGGAFPSGTVTFAVGEKSKQIVVNVTGDTWEEQDELFEVRLSAVSGATVREHERAIGVVTRDEGVSGPGPATLSLSPSSVTHAEGNSGATAFTYTVVRSGDTSGTASVNWAVAGSGAAPASASDFAGGAFPSGSLSFAAGETSKTITVNVVGDTSVESNESFTVTLSGAVGAGLGQASAAGVISNDDGTTGGQFYDDPNPNGSDTIIAGSGDDTLAAGYNADRLTGGAGADDFLFRYEPWNAHTITDFGQGADQIDLTPLFSQAGVTWQSGDPVQQGYVLLNQVGGDTVVAFDRDAGGSAYQWPISIVTVVGKTPAEVRPTLILPSGSGGGQEPGRVVQGQNEQVANRLEGGSGNDTILAGWTEDTLIGNGGSDLFVFRYESWRPSHVTDFLPGTDRLDFTQLFDTYAPGYAGSDPVADQYLRFSDGPGGVRVEFDRDGAGSGVIYPITITILDGRTASEIGRGDWVF